MSRRFITPQHAPRNEPGQYTGRRIACRPTIRLIVLASLVALFPSCSPSDPYADIHLPSTPVITLRPTWALVDAPYVRLYEESDPTSPIAGHLRRGDVVRIAAISTDIIRVAGEEVRWFLLEHNAFRGWTTGTVLELFTSEERARSAARVRREGF